MLKSDSVTGFPIGWTNIGILPFPGTKISYSVVVFLGLALLFGVVLHATPIGRSIYAIGLQQEAAFFSGIRVRRIKFWLFVLSGVVCALAGILWTFRFATARYNNGTGLELNAVAMVLLAGVSIFGGRGTIVGIVLSAAVLGCLQQAMTLENVPAQVQSIVIGVLLLVSVVVPNGPALAERVRRRLGSSRHSGAAAAKGISILTGPGTSSAIGAAGPPLPDTAHPGWQPDPAVSSSEGGGRKTDAPT
jgi:rhamnose transport system permease protein